MSLYDRAQSDILSITTNLKEFGKTIYLTALNGQTATVIGIHAKHWSKVDRDSGMVINGKHATASISESEILTANPNYPIRNGNGEVAMIGNKLNVKDSTGILKNYVILENWSDETIGLITFTLGDYKAA